ncbi:MAG: DNA polymerase III subunit delta' [Butyribacter sp.]|jgi:DNA polymerase III, delta' subunit|uniref:DNA polymerase III subunit delta' n=1 Tax=Butyribacter TaxID=2822463 RepID=UPI0009622F97|nr:DNA polymerase III subunit delta' [Clostridium sp.]MCQ5165743.1 DNA polymerase III subunit delta' [Roseburia hominis]OKZ79338.1 MAG: DNA polymerase III subunit delta' [Clostridium sp. CAG:12237_41]
MANFKDIIGQESIKKHLQTAIKTGNLSHAYIINGEYGSGRQTIASALAKTIQCQSKTDDTDACGVCTSCKQAESHNHPDIKYITHDKTSISVNDIREQLNNDISIKPYSSEYKIYIIPDANKMTEQAQNALLKTIEEPPVYAIIILLTENCDSLLPTIRSRCVTLTMNPIEKDKICTYLENKFQLEPEQAQIAANYCQGNIGKAIRFASSSDFIEMKNQVLKLLKNLDSMDIASIIDTIKEFSTHKNDINDYLDLMLLWYRDVLMFKVTKDANLLLYSDEYSAISEQATKRDYENIENIIAAIDKAKVRLKANVNFDVTIELMILAMKD